MGSTGNRGWTSRLRSATERGGSELGRLRSRPRRWWCHLVLASCRAAPRGGRARGDRRRPARRRRASGLVALRRACPRSDRDARRDPRRSVARRFTASRVSARARVRMLVFVNAMIPVPGATAGDWWANTGWEEARVEAANRCGYSPSFDNARTSCTTLRPRSQSEEKRRSAPRPMSCSASPASLRRGPQSRSTWSPDATIGSFRSSSSAASHRNGCTSESTSFQVAISSLSQTRAVSSVSTSPPLSTVD
jgi:hypothetical protein